MTDQTTAPATPGPALASARKGTGPTPRDLAARAASRETADPRPAGDAEQARPRPGSAPDRKSVV